MSIEIGQEFLEKYGLTGLSSIIAAAIAKAEQSDPRIKKVLFHATVQEVCRIAIETGMEPGDLCEAAMTILEISNKELVCLRQKANQKRNDKISAEEKDLTVELFNEGV